LTWVSGLAVWALLTTAALLGNAPADAGVPGSNGRIVFARQICASDTAPCWELVVANPRDTGEKVVAGPYPRSVWDDHFIANWSPDGRRIIFMADLGQGQAIWQMNANGRHLHKLFTAPPGGGLDDGPAYTPDGRHIIFTRCCPAISGYALWEIRSDGTHLRQFTDDSVPPGVDGPSDNLPQVSPNGHLVAFHRNHDGVNRVTVAHYPSGKFREITPPDFDAQIPNWSPDGKRLVLEHDGDVWTIRPNGHGLTELTFATDDTFSFEPSYSPDGSRIIFSRYTPRGNVDLYTMRPDGTDLKPLTRTSTDERWAHWAPACVCPLPRCGRS
jgi:TolB protein